MRKSCTSIPNEVARRYTNTHSADLRNADLRHANLSEADLGNAKLSHADLRGADLRGADLSYADLSHATLDYADLSYANFGFTILVASDLRNVNLTSQHLTGEAKPFLCNAALPETLRNAGIDPNRDCAVLPKLLKERYPGSNEDFQKLVEEAMQKQWD